MIISQTLTKDVVAKIKGRTLESCQLPQSVRTRVGQVLNWQIPKEGIPVVEPQNNPVEECLAVIPQDKENGSVPVPEDVPRPEPKNPYTEFLDSVAGAEEDPAAVSDKRKVGEERKAGQEREASRNGPGGREAETGSGGGETAIGQPWLRNQNIADDSMTKKAEENMTRIAGEFCCWLRDLPGEDKTVNQIGETHLRSLFDTAQSANPGTTKLAEGLRSWAKFGSEVGGTAGGRATQRAAEAARTFEQKLAGSDSGAECGNSRERRAHYGAWYGLHCIGHAGLACSGIVGTDVVSIWFSASLRNLSEFSLVVTLSLLYW